MRLASLVSYCCYLLMLGLPSIKRHYNRQCVLRLILREFRVRLQNSHSGCSRSSVRLRKIACVFIYHVDLLRHFLLLQCPHLRYPPSVSARPKYIMVRRTIISIGCPFVLVISAKEIARSDCGCDCSV